MTAVAADGPLDRVGPWSLFTEALWLLRRAWPWALAFAAVLVGLPWLLNYLPIEQQLGIVLPYEVALARQAAHLVLASLLGAVLLRRLAAEPTAQRLDREFLEGGGILLLLGAIPLAFGMVAREWVSTEPSEVWKTVLATTIAGFALAFVSMRVFLWPIARLSHRADVTPARSWALTRGTVLSYILVMAGLFIPFLAVSTATPLLLGENGYAGFFELQRTVIQPVFTVVMSVMGMAMSAAVYGRRVGAPQNVADVFS